ncbi:hypothetical protein BJX62DRAFT_241542 [Aspergillus germanicus]
MNQPILSPPRTIAFFGAFGGCGHATLAAALSAGHTCLALCRNPSKLQSLRTLYPNTLIIRSGNGHSLNDAMRVLTHDERHLVDAVNCTIGNKPNLKAAARGNKGDPHERVGLAGIAVAVRGVYDGDVIYPLYQLMLAVPHKDKKPMEGWIVRSRERFVLVRPGLLWDGGEEGKAVRVGISDVRKGRVERKEVGYTISRKVLGGEWMFENLGKRASQGILFEGKAVTLTF